LGVDRGSIVKHGQTIAKLSAPELGAQTNQSVNEARAARDERAQSQADLKALEEEEADVASRLKAEEDMYTRLKEASSYPGVIALNDLEIAQKKVEADRDTIKSYDARRASYAAKIKALDNKEKAAIEAADSTKDIQEYLTVTAPFDGVITERNVHEGSF